MKYAICCHGRSGGHLLGDMLAQTGKAGFNNNRHVELLIGHGAGLKDIDYVYQANMQMLKHSMTPNGVQAIKINFPYLLALKKWQSWENIGKLLLNFDKHVLLTRDNIAQAISWYIASREGQWRYDQKPNGRKAEYNYKAIATMVAVMDMSESFFLSFVYEHGSDCYQMDYDSLAENPQRDTQHLLDWLGIEADCADIQPRMKRQHDTRKQEWYDRYLKDRSRLHG